MNNYLLPKYLVDFYAGNPSLLAQNEGRYSLELDLEIERQQAIKNAARFVINKTHQNIDRLLSRECSEDCTKTIKENLEKVKEDVSDVRYRTFSTIFSKYIKNETVTKTEEDNLFTEYMKRQVCAELPRLGRLIDLVYKKCQDIKLSDRLNVINDAVYQAFLEYLSTTDLIMPNNKEERVGPERVGKYSTSSIDSNGPDLCMKNCLKYNNTVINCISREQMFDIHPYVRCRPYTNQRIAAFLRTIIEEEQKDDCYLSGTEEDGVWVSNINICDDDSYRHIGLHIPSTNLLRYSFEDIMDDSNPLLDVKSFFISSYVSTTVDADDFKVNIGFKKRTAPDDVVWTAEELVNNQTYSADIKLIVEEAGDELNSLVHSFIRKDHALEDVISIFVQLLATEVPDDDKEDRGQALLLGKMCSNHSRDCVVRAVMAAIIAPVKTSLSGFTVAPDLDLIARIAGMSKELTSYYLYRFSLAFGLEFFASRSSSGVSGISYYLDKLYPRASDNIVFHIGGYGPFGIFKDRQPDKCYIDIIKPRLKKMLVGKALNIHSTDDAASSIAIMDIIRAASLTPEESLILNSDFIRDPVLKPAIAFYCSVIESVVYAIGLKAASLLPYHMERMLVAKDYTPQVRLKAVVYGMGSGLIHALFESATDSNTNPEVAIPVSQYIVPNITEHDMSLFNKLNTYAGGIIFNTKLLIYYLTSSAKVIKDASLFHPDLKGRDVPALNIIDNLPVFKSIKTLYINDPDCVNTFAPGFKGVFKPGDRARLEESLAKARHKVEELYYVITARRPLVPEECLEDESHSISMLMDADRTDINLGVFLHLYDEIYRKCSTVSMKAVANPDVGKVCLDARPLCLKHEDVCSLSDTVSSAGTDRDYLLMGEESSDSVVRDSLGLSFYPAHVVRKLLPPMKAMAIKGRRRGYPMIGLFLESNKTTIANKKNNTFVPFCPRSQLYKVTDRRGLSRRYPILSLSEFSGRTMVDNMSNGLFNSVSDQVFPDDDQTLDMFRTVSVIPNKIGRLTADTCFLPPYTNYRFVEAERRRWNPEKYPNYRVSAYIKKCTLSSPYESVRSCTLYNSSPWQLSGRVRVLDMERSRRDLFTTYRPLNLEAASIERKMEKKRLSLLTAIRSDSRDRSSESAKKWSQVWLENVINQINSQQNTSSSSSMDPYIFSDLTAREIAATFCDDYRTQEMLTMFTLADTEDISKSLNIYMEPVDAEDDSLAHRKARMRMIALIVLGMNQPCTQGFLDVINEKISIEDDSEDEKASEDYKYEAACKSRELTEISSEIRVNSTKSDIDKEMSELRRQKEEYCKKFRESMNTLKKQRKSLMDNRCFLNNKDAFTEEEKGIESLYKNGQIMGYRLVCRDKRDRSAGSEGTTVLLDTETFLADKKNYLKNIANRNMSVDLIALTTPIYIWSGAFIFSIGKVTINIRDIFDSKNIKPQFYNEDADMLTKYSKAGLDPDDIPRSSLLSSGSMDAPHVRNHRACLGNLEGNLNAAATSEDILAYLEWCLLYLTTVKLGDPYGSCLSYFPCVPATLHNVIKYGVLDSGRLDDKICLWTGARNQGSNNPYNTNVVQPVWNMSDDLITALWNDARKKLEDGMFEGSDITVDDLLPIAAELSDRSRDDINWRTADNVYRNLLSYSMCKEEQDQNPELSLSTTSRAVVEPIKFSSALRVGISQKLEHRDYFMQKSLRFMQYAQDSGRSFSSLWNKNDLDDNRKLCLLSVKVDRLQSYHINI